MIFWGAANLGIQEIAWPENNPKYTPFGFHQLLKAGCMS